ncbi:hypothetical protein [Streptomyces sp. NPDC054849]
MNGGEATSFSAAHKAELTITIPVDTNWTVDRAERADVVARLASDNGCSSCRRRAAFSQVGELVVEEPPDSSCDEHH